MGSQQSRSCDDVDADYIQEPRALDLGAAFPARGTYIPRAMLIKRNETLTNSLTQRSYMITSTQQFPQGAMARARDEHHDNDRA